MRRDMFKQHELCPTGIQHKQPLTRLANRPALSTYLLMPKAHSVTPRFICPNTLHTCSDTVPLLIGTFVSLRYRSKSTKSHSTAQLRTQKLPIAFIHSMEDLVMPGSLLAPLSPDVKANT